MSKKGENIYKRKDGRWEARYLKGYAPDGQGRYGFCYGRSYREAKEKMTAARLEQLEEEGPLPAAKKRFAVYCEEWLNLRKARVKESTYVIYRTALDKHILPALGGCVICALTSAMVAEFREAMIAEGLARKTVRDTLAVVRAVLAYAQEEEPSLRPVKVVYPKEGRREMRVLTREEQQRLTAYLLTDMDGCKFGVLLALLTGLRIGEVCALRWRDVSLSEKMLTVSSTMLRLRDFSPEAERKTKIVLSDPKTGASVREIPLTDFAAALCARFRAEEDEAFLLTGESDRYIEPRVLQYRLERYTADCGLAGVHFHALRHTFATRCVEVGFELKSLSEILGHTSPRFTLERYVHSSMELKRENMEKLAKIGC